MTINFLSFRVGNLEDVLLAINKDLSTIATYLCTNSLLANPDKTKIMFFGSAQMLKYIPSNTSFTFLGKTIRPVQNVKDLGLTMDPTLSFDEHIKQVVSSSMKKLHQINRIKHLFTPLILEMIIQSCVFSKLFYCSTVWSATSYENISKLQSVQNFAARIVTGTRKYDHITPVLKQLKWLPVEMILYLRDCIMTYKCMNNSLPDYLCEKFTLRSEISGRMTRQNNKLHKPLYRTSTAQKSFLFRASTLWNDLNELLKSKPTVVSFKYNLKQDLLKRFLN